MPRKIEEEVQTNTNPPSRQSMPPFEALRAFDAVARFGGVRRGAQWLQRDHAVVSRHVRGLETWLGVELIRRQSSGALLTPQGKRYHAIIADAMDRIAYGTMDLLNHGQHNALTIFCAPGFAFFWLSGHLDAFEAKNNGIDLLLRPSERSPDFAAYEADVDIRFVPADESRPKPQSLVRELALARVPVIAVAGPKYLAQAKPITKPFDLLSHHLLHEENFGKWTKWIKSSGIAEVGKLNGVRYSQGHLTLEAARKDRGIELANPITAGTDLVSGRLIEIGKNDPAFRHRYADYVLSIREDRWNDRIPKRFRLWLAQMLEREFPQYPPPG